MPRDPLDLGEGEGHRRALCVSHLIAVLVLILVCLSFVIPAAAQERMRIAWAGSTPSNTPIWVADQKGFFKKNGLNVEVISISASTIVIQALLTGEVDFIIAPSATLVTSKLAGADTVMVSTNCRSSSTTSCRSAASRLSNSSKARSAASTAWARPPT